MEGRFCRILSFGTLTWPPPVQQTAHLSSMVAGAVRTSLGRCWAPRRARSSRGLLPAGAAAVLQPAWPSERRLLAAGAAGAADLVKSSMTFLHCATAECAPHGGPESSYTRMRSSNRLISSSSSAAATSLCAAGAAVLHACLSAAW